MTRPRRELLALILPALTFVGVEWAMWGRRNELAGWGVEVDAGALGVAFVVALAFGGTTAKLDRSWPDALLLRLANACVYLIGAAVCAFVCGLMRLRMIDLASLEVPPPELVLVRTGVILVTGVGASHGLAIGLSSLAPRRAFLLASATVALAALSVWRMSTSGTVRFEALRAEPAATVELDALTMDVATRPLRVADVDWQYIAVGKSCSLQRAGPEGPSLPAAWIDPISVNAHFAVCPTLSLRRAGDRVLGVAGQEEVAKFQIHDGRVSTIAADQARALTAEASEIVSLPELRAPTVPLIESRSSAGVLVERRVSDAACTVRVSVDGHELSKHDHHPHGDRQRLCDPVRASRSAVGILSVRVGEAPQKAELWFRDAQVTSVHLQDLEPAITPPRLWSTLAWSGVGASALLVVLASLELLRLRALRGFVAAEHVGGGMIILSDERRFTAASATRLESGPVMVRGELPAASHAGYRERADLATSALEIRSAAAHEHELDRGGDRVRAASVAALTLTLSTSVLLIAAWLLGFGH